MQRVLHADERQSRERDHEHKHAERSCDESDASAWQHAGQNEVRSKKQRHCGHGIQDQWREYVDAREASDECEQQGPSGR